MPEFKEVLADALEQKNRIEAIAEKLIENEQWDILKKYTVNYGKFHEAVVKNHIAGKGLNWFNIK